MQLREIMTSEPLVLNPEAVLREAAQRMRELDRVMPIGEHDRLVGMLTDRDITVRATAEGKDPNTTRVRDVMTPDVAYCLDDEDIETADLKMVQHQIRRLIVLNRDKRLVGIASRGDLAGHAPSDRLPGEVTEAVSEPTAC
jgi:CBS domain-containing protein